jgi:hypothetical protein
MAFLRWGFNQRSLQPQSFNVDPLLPMNAAPTDTCLITELVKLRMTKENAQSVCKSLSVKCKVEAEKMMKIKQELQISPSTNNKTFTLLTPAQSYKPRSNSLRERDIRAFNINEREQYKIIYDYQGSDEYAIPLNSSRLNKLQYDYTRTTGLTIQTPVQSDQLFLRRLWCMLSRYDTISGAGYQAALPEDAFHILQKKFGVQHECYASPLNHCLDSYGTGHWKGDLNQIHHS